jgi:hypothetical protein
MRQSKPVHLARHVDISEQHADCRGLRFQMGQRFGMYGNFWSLPAMPLPPQDKQSRHRRKSWIGLCIQSSVWLTGLATTCSVLGQRGRVRPNRCQKAGIRTRG